MKYQIGTLTESLCWIG